MYKKVSVTITTTLVIAAILTVSWSALQRSHAQTNGNLADTILQIHKSERAAVNVPPIAWSASLAADAQSYAQHLTTLGLGPRDILPHATGTGQGENLSWGHPGFYSPADGVRQWAAEKSNYKGTPISQADFRPGAPMIGHYTQMVWKNTSEVGCGTASSSTLEVLVCRYSPPGNYLGETPY
jgi:pathogenesis-related protein 1